MAPRLTFRLSLGAAHYVFASALAIRLLALSQLTASPFLLPSRGDMHFYNDWAQRILQGQFTDHHAFYGMPLYAYLLAFLYKLFGYSPFIPGFLQAILEAGTATLIYKIATRVFANESRPAVAEGTARNGWSRQKAARMIGGIAALGWVFFAPAQAYSVILMPTTWLIFVFWFLVWQVVRGEAAPGKIPSLLFGLLVGVTAMGIATIFFIVPLLLAAIILFPAYPARHRRSHGVRAKLGAAALLFMGLGVGTAPCWLHNVFVAHDRLTLSTHSGINFWIGNNPVANGYPRIPPGLRAGQAAMLQDSIAVAEAAAGHPLKRSEVSKYWSDKARDYIRGNFGDWLKLMIVKVRNFWNAFQYDDLSIITGLREEGVILPGPRFGLIAALALPGMILAWMASPRSRWIAAAILLHMMSLLTVFVTERYRLAAVPGLLVFAAFSFWKLFEFGASARLGNAAVLAGAIALSALFVSLPQRDPALWALEAYNSGWQALESHNLPLAEKKLQTAYAYVPGNTEINLALGNLRLEQGDVQAARVSYFRVLAVDEHHKSALNNLGVLDLNEGNWTTAKGFFGQAIEQEPGNAKTHFLLARAYFGAGEFDAARTAVDRALQLSPLQAEFLALRDELASRSP